MYYPMVISIKKGDDYGHEYDVPIAFMEFATESDKNEFMRIYETALARIRKDCESYENGEPLEFGNDDSITEYYDFFGYKCIRFCYDYEKLLFDIGMVFESMAIDGHFCNLTRLPSIEFNSIHSDKVIVSR